MGDVEKNGGGMRLQKLLFLLCACWVTGMQSANAQVYPVRPIKLIVPFAEKGAADIISRLLANRLSGIMQQPVVVQNMQGGGGALASEYVALSAPDGYTVLYVTGATLVNGPIFSRAPRYDPLASFAPIAFVSLSPSALAVHPSFPAQKFDQLMAAIKDAPGRYRYATLGPGSHSFLTGELFKSQTQLDVKEVVTKRRAWELVANGDADMIFDAAVPLFTGVKEQRMRMLAVMGHARFPSLPEVPTTVELGHPELTSYVWSALVAPARTPPEIIQVLNQATQSVLSEIETQATFSRYGMHAEGSTPAELRQFIGSELTKWSRALPLSATAGK